MQFIAGKKALRVLDVPVTMRYTDKPKRAVMWHGLQVLSGVFKLMAQYRPTLYIGLPGLSFVLGSLGWGVLVANRFSHTSQQAVGNALNLPTSIGDRVDHDYHSFYTSRVAQLTDGIAKADQWRLS